MNKFIIIIVLLFLGTSVQAEENTVEIGNQFEFKRDLTIGSKGQDVVYLQTFLEEKGYLTMPDNVAKGYFGSLTQSALAAWQKSKNITLDDLGYLGSESKAKIYLSTPIYRSDDPGALTVIEFECLEKTKPIIFKDISSNLYTMTLEVVHKGEEIKAHYYEHKSDGKKFIFRPEHLNIISKKFDLSLLSDNKLLLQGYWLEPDKVFQFTEFIFRAEEIFPKAEKGDPQKEEKPKKKEVKILGSPRMA